MDIQNLQNIASQMLTLGKGLLAADESVNTVGKRFAAINLENNEENRRAFRDMLLTVKGSGEFISGAILFDETIRQKSLSGASFLAVLKGEGIIPGIKVDQGLVSVGSGAAEEKLTKGLGGLADRLKEYYEMGARFTKWRSVITIGPGVPTEENIKQNARDLAQFALDSQNAGLVPVVEPEVLMDGEHSKDSCKQASFKILSATFEELEKQRVYLKGLILKTNMVLPGKKSFEKAVPQKVARETLDLLERVLPDSLAGVAFLSGGQTEIEATQNLNAINSFGPKPWPLTFSFARALQDGATKVWQGKAENVEAAQEVFLHRAKMNSLASLGKYHPQMENGFYRTN